MRLASASHELLEAFFRRHNNDESLALPRIVLNTGRFAAWLTRTFRIGAITLGRRVFIAPRLLTRNASGQTCAPAPLIAHESAHVLQYERAGWARFLCRYVREYIAGLKREGGNLAERHGAAYRAISFEREARAAERAYDAWAREGTARDASLLPLVND